jgi:phage nucleotide-binding protein
MIKASSLPFETLPNKVERGVSIVVYANPGIGKTTLAATLPQGPGKTLIINTEAGIAPLMGSDHLIFNLQKAIANGKNVEEAMNGLYKSIRTGEPGYQFENIVLDNVSELSDQLCNHYTKVHNKELPEIREHGDTAFKFREWIHNWRDLVEMGTNVIINAWEQDYDIAIADGIVTTRTCPKVGRSNVPSVCGLCDVVARLEVHEKSGERWLRIGPHRQYITKTQFKGLKKGEVADLPTIINKIKEYDYSKGEE